MDIIFSLNATKGAYCYQCPVYPVVITYALEKINYRCVCFHSPLALEIRVWKVPQLQVCAIGSCLLSVSK